MFTKDKRADTASGILFVTLFALAATQISQWQWIHKLGISPLIIGIVLGISYANTLHHRMPKAWLPGISFTARKILRVAVILYGFYITLQEVMMVGWIGFAAASFIVISTLCIAYFVGVYLLGMDKQTTLLTGAGSAICGAAAILAFEPVIKAKGHQTSAAVATVVLFGTLAMLIYPLIYQWGILNLDAHGWGIYIGATVHEVAQVVGTASDISQTVCNDAVIVKMTRVMLLVPALLFMGWWWGKYGNNDGDGTTASLTVPWFALGFLGVVGLNSLHLLPISWVILLQHSDQFLLTMAMTALGMVTNLNKLKGVGIKPFMLAMVLFVWLIIGGFTVISLLI